MSEIRNLEDVKNALTRSLNSAKFEKELWEKVEICKKKDGSDFAVVSKSYKNAIYSTPAYAGLYHPEILVRGHNIANNKWEEYSLYAYIYADTLADDDERKSKAVKANQWSRETYLLTPDEVAIKIRGRVLDLRLRIARLEKELEIADDVYNKFIKAITEAIIEMKKDTACVRLDDRYYNHSELEYRLIDVLDSAGSCKLHWELSK